MNRNISLAFETALGGGSFSIFENGRELDFLCNSNMRSRAEDLLLIIENLLLKNRLGKQEIRKIIYSNGPGSQTGIRIGAATAKALAQALNCECFEVGLLYALTFYTEQKGLFQPRYRFRMSNFVCKILKKRMLSPLKVNRNEFQKVI